MKILHITDSHGTVKSPESRKDIYYLAFLRKMYELKYVIKQEDIKLILHTGDLFHSSRVSDKFAGQLAEIIKSYGIPMYVLPGNHDIEGYTIDTIDQTKLGLLYKTGVVKRLDRSHPLFIKSQKENISVNIAGQEYYKDIDDGNVDDLNMQMSNQADFNILCYHGFLCDTSPNPLMKVTLCKDVLTDADVILSGHYHRSFKYQDQDFCIYNPGSLMRVDRTEYNKTHMPQYGILEITRNSSGNVQHTYNFCKFKIAAPADEVFDFEAADRKKHTLITLENFKNSIANTNFNSNMNTSIENIINDVSNNFSLDSAVEQRTIDVYHNALNNSPDKLEMPSGYISDTKRKIITSVEINNFQSHKNTTMKFTDGLNVIVGESNSGKTAILRAIKWVLDNEPRGSDFITTGEDDCSVTVNFDDGTYITRKRTRSNSGEYVVHGKTDQPDGSVTYWSSVYQGFGNGLPVEVINTHQMPNVNLTKDLSTHLNMMCQLDGPFLVTESPQNKAAIIGRLTGTQIIDLAIKDTNKDILSNSKKIKFLKEQKEKKESELTEFQDIPYMEQFVDLTKQIIFKIDKEYADIERCFGACDMWKNANYRINKNILPQLDEINNRLDGIKMLISIIKYIISLNETVSIMKDYNSVKLSVLNFMRQIQWLRVLHSVKPFVYECTNKVHSLVQLKNIYDSYFSVKNNIVGFKSLIGILKDAAFSFNALFGYINVLSKDINNTVPTYNSCSFAINRIGILQNDLNSYQESINNLQGQIAEVIKQQQEIIKNNNICPCCGRKITQKDQVQNIANFMKGWHKKS